MFLAARRAARFLFADHPALTLSVVAYLAAITLSSYSDAFSLRVSDAASPCCSDALVVACLAAITLSSCSGALVVACLTAITLPSGSDAFSLACLTEANRNHITLP